VNKVMVLTGYAWWFERYAQDEVQLQDAQEAAQDAMRGLWIESMAVAPWEWRKGVRKVQASNSQPARWQASKNVRLNATFAPSVPKMNDRYLPRLMT